MSERIEAEWTKRKKAVTNVRVQRARVESS
jgi:hypothetical protein